jgi:hypothetical protein
MIKTTCIFSEEVLEFLYTINLRWSIQNELRTVIMNSEKGEVYIGNKKISWTNGGKIDILVEQLGINGLIK